MLQSFLWGLAFLGGLAFSSKNCFPNSGLWAWLWNLRRNRLTRSHLTGPDCLTCFLSNRGHCSFLGSPSFLSPGPLCPAPPPYNLGAYSLLSFGDIPKVFLWWYSHISCIHSYTRVHVEKTEFRAKCHGVGSEPIMLNSAHFNFTPHGLHSCTSPFWILGVPPPNTHTHKIVSATWCWYGN